MMELRRHESTFGLIILDLRDINQSRRRPGSARMFVLESAGITSSRRRGSQTQHSMGVRSGDNLTYVWKQFTHRVISLLWSLLTAFGVFLFDNMSRRTISCSGKRDNVSGLAHLQYLLN